MKAKVNKKTSTKAKMPKKVKSPVKKSVKKSVPKFKTKKQIKEKIVIFENMLKEIQDKYNDMKGRPMMPNELNKLYDLQLQISSGVDLLQWVLGEKG